MVGHKPDAWSCDIKIVFIVHKCKIMMGKTLKKFGNLANGISLQLFFENFVIFINCHKLHIFNYIMCCENFYLKNIVNQIVKLQKLGDKCLVNLIFNYDMHKLGNIKLV